MTTPEQEEAERIIELFRNQFINGDPDVWAGPSKACAEICVQQLIELATRVSDIEGNYFRLSSTGNYGDAEKELEHWNKVLEIIKSKP